MSKHDLMNACLSMMGVSHVSMLAPCFSLASDFIKTRVDADNLVEALANMQERDLQSVFQLLTLKGNHEQVFSIPQL